MIFRTTLTAIRTLWFTVSIISTIWFLYWICYEALIWNKILTQATPINYIAFVLSITSIIIGTQLGKIRILTKPKVLPEQKFLKNSPKKIKHSTFNKNKTKNKPIKFNTLMKEKARHPKTLKPQIKCRFYLGYLHKRPQSENIPEECLLCNQMVNCMLK